jgi:transposase-like protein
MLPMNRFLSESAAADLLEQVDWRDGVECPRCRSDLRVRNGSYRAYQRYLCENCGRTFNDKTGPIFAYSKLSLTEWFLIIYFSLRFNVGIRQSEAELGRSYRTVRGRVECSGEALDAPSITVAGLVEINEAYVSAGKKGCERDSGRARAGSSDRNDIQDVETGEQRVLTDDIYSSSFEKADTAVTSLQRPLRTIRTLPGSFSCAGVIANTLRRG